MISLSHVRRSLAVCRVALACYLLSLGFAIASPLVSGTQTQMLCSGTGISLVSVPVDADHPAPLTPKLDCPLCGLGFGLPPEAVKVFVAEVAAVAEAPPPPLSAPQSQVFRAWQARAPPES
jgi:hypothetical protein